MTRTRRSARTLVGAAVLSLVAAPLVGLLPAARASGGTGPSVGAGAPGLPDDGPPALYAPEPALPIPDGWPAPDVFSRTSGTGRLSAGAFYWTDFLYDDHGAIGVPGGDPMEDAGTPPFGTYGYPAGNAHGNGADIFRAAVLLRSDATYWRVDWNTLADPTVPIAEWTFDTDGLAATGASAWPAGAGVQSAGIDKALVMSSHGAQLIDPASSAVLATFPVTVDMTAHSFVARIPRTALAPTGAWTVRLAAGLANADGSGFAPATGALPGETAVYNVTFRQPAQEPIGNNPWDDDSQAEALTQGDVSAFATTVNWADLAARRTTPEPAPTGWSDRWYASSIDLGPGVITDASSVSGGAPNFLGRVQPYAVYVPTNYSSVSAAPLTFMLHSLTQNQNQYASESSKFTEAACEQRGSICVTTLGRGPDGNYVNTAELDFWEVWHQVAATYRLDPNRTVLSGYSMGGIGTNKLAMAHPDLYARAITLAGSTGVVPAMENLRWIPVYLEGGAADELVPVTSEKAEADALDGYGYRYRWLLYPDEDHVAPSLQNPAWTDAVAYMGDATRVTRPGHVTYHWNESATPAGLGLGTTGAYWLRSLAARSPQQDSHVDGVSGAQPDPVVTPLRSQSAYVAPAVDPLATSVEPTPALVTELRWQTAPPPAAGSVITLALTNVSSLTILLAQAGFVRGQHGSLHVHSDGPVTVTLGTRVLTLPGGDSEVAFTA